MKRIRSRNKTKQAETKRSENQSDRFFSPTSFGRNEVKIETNKTKNLNQYFVAIFAVIFSAVRSSDPVLHGLDDGAPPAVIGTIMIWIISDVIFDLFSGAKVQRS